GALADDLPAAGCAGYAVGGSTGASVRADQAVGAAAVGEDEPGTVGQHQRLQSGAQPTATGGGREGERHDFRIAVGEADGSTRFAAAPVSVGWLNPVAGAQRRLGAGLPSAAQSTWGFALAGGTGVGGARGGQWTGGASLLGPDGWAASGEGTGTGQGDGAAAAGGKGGLGRPEFWGLLGGLPFPPGAASVLAAAHRSAGTESEWGGRCRMPAPTRKFAGNAVAKTGAVTRRSLGKPPWKAVWRRSRFSEQTASHRNCIFLRASLCRPLASPDYT